MAVGFRFEPTANGIPSSVFFPQAGPEYSLSPCSASLQALLALTPLTLQALAKLVSTSEMADDIAVIRIYWPNILPKVVLKWTPLLKYLCHQLQASRDFGINEF